MKVSNHEKAQPGDTGVSRETLRKWQKRDADPQGKAVKRRDRPGAAKGDKATRKQREL